jgi:hypothetical protein
MITKDIETAANRVKSKSSVYARMIRDANAFINEETELRLGPPMPVKKSAQNANPSQGANQSQSATMKSSQLTAQNATANSSQSAAQGASAKQAQFPQTAPAGTVRYTPTPETTLPNQSKDVAIAEFEIIPEATAAKAAAKKQSTRRGAFGFTLSPIITVRRPNRPQ